MVLLLTRLVDNVDALNKSHQTVLSTNEQMVLQLAAQKTRISQQDHEIQKLRVTRAAEAAVLTPRETQGPPVGSISVPGSDDGVKKKFYAVANGRIVGVFTRWKDADRSVRGYSGSIHKRFRSDRAARNWLAERTGTTRLDDASEFSDDITQRDDTIYGSQTRAAGHQSRLPTSVIDPRQAGPDPSVGKPNEIHNTSIQVESEVLEILCPKGVITVRPNGRDARCAVFTR
jgi:hypothetical protein